MWRIPLTQDYFALVDDEDADLVSCHYWSVKRDAHNLYAQGRIGAHGTASMHRLIRGMPRGVIVDHCNGNGLDNRRDNLRLCSPVENQRNRAKRQAGLSRYKGVSWDARRGQWLAQICHSGRVDKLAFFEDEVGAALAYDDAACLLFEDYARVNFPKNSLDEHGLDWEAVPILPRREKEFNAGHSIDTASGTVTVPLTRGAEALCDLTDWPMLHRHRWCVTGGKTKYAVTCVGAGRNVLMHRMLVGPDESRGLDHINHNGLDNRRQNLRFCTQSQNMMNASKRAGTSSRFRGVCWVAAKGLWRAEVQALVHL
jgi:hypothetical protein